MHLPKQLSEAQRSKILAVCRANPRLFIEKFLKIQTKDAGLVPFRLNAPQRLVYRIIQDLRAKKKPVRLVILKARQMGISTLIEGLLFSQACLRENNNCLITSHDKGSAERIFRMSEIFLDNLPEQIAPMVRHRTKSLIRFENPDDSRRLESPGLRSQIQIATAKNVDVGASFTLHGGHLCLAPGTPILTGDGSITPVEDVRVGDHVITHTGKATRVSAITTRKNYLPGIRVTAGPMQDVVMTANHPVWTQRGWVPAGDLTRFDMVSMPLRAITDDLDRSPLRLRESARRKTAHATIPLTADTGFAIGYYLIKGRSVWKTYKGGHAATALCFGRRRDEEAYADRVERAFRGLYTSRTSRPFRGDTFVTDQFYGTSLAETMTTHFGHTRKFLPDWVFHAGKDFCRGILHGFLVGAGYTSAFMEKCYLPPEMEIAVPEDPGGSVLTQIRDLAASLGYGWGCIYHSSQLRAQDTYRKPTWMLRFTGDSSMRMQVSVQDDFLLDYSGMEVRAHRYLVKDQCVWLKVHDLKDVSVPDVWDIEVEHEDHSFRTLYFSVKNSEFARWPFPEAALLSIMNAVPDHPDTMVAIESTPMGMGGAFYDIWQRAVQDSSEWTPVFLPYWVHDEYQTPIQGADREKLAATLTEEERRIMKEYAPAMVLERIHWRRRTIDQKCGGSVSKFQQEYPVDALSCFIASGHSVFDPEAIIYHRKFVKKGRRGRLVRNATGQQVSFIPDVSGPLEVWKPPKVGEDYCVPGDTWVRTGEGPKPISDVTVGDHVLTHRGHYRQVTRVFRRVTQDPLIEVKATGFLPLRITGNHQILTFKRGFRHKFNAPARWLAVDDGLSTEHFVAAAHPLAVVDVKEIDLLNGEGYVKGVLRVKDPDRNKSRLEWWVSVDNQFCFTLGYYAAEGSRGSNAVGFASHHREGNIRRYVMDYLRAIGLSPREQLSSVSKGAVVTVGSKPLARFFQKMGKSIDKHFPEWVMLLPPEKQVWILIGYFIGDGNFSSDGLRAKTISLRLATQIRELGGRTGFPIGMRLERKGGVSAIFDRKSVVQTQYSLKMASSHTQRLAGVIPPDILQDKLFRTPNGGRNGKTTLHEHYQIGKVSRVRETNNGPTEVFNLEVAEDNSYVANGVVVHNCLGADSGMGMVKRRGGGHGDYSAAVVLSNHMEQVAQIRAHLDPHDFADYLDMLGRWYNTALVFPEVDGYGGGYAVAYALNETYPRIGVTEVWDTKSRRRTEVMGFEPTGKSVPILVSKLVREVHRSAGITMETGADDADDEGARESGYQFSAAYRERQRRSYKLKIYSEDLCSEMTTYIINEQGKVGAISKGNDDIIRALGLAIMGLEQIPPPDERDPVLSAIEKSSEMYYDKRGVSLAVSSGTDYPGWLTGV